MSLGAYTEPVSQNFMVLSFKMAEIIANNGKIENGSKLTLDSMGRYPKKIKILKFRFFHVTRKTIRYFVDKFLGPRISNG